MNHSRNYRTYVPWEWGWRWCWIKWRLLFHVQVPQSLHGLEVKKGSDRPRDLPCSNNPPGKSKAIISHKEGGRHQVKSLGLRKRLSDKFDTSEYAVKIILVTVPIWLQAWQTHSWFRLWGRGGWDWRGGFWPWGFSDFGRVPSVDWFTGWLRIKCSPGPWLQGGKLLPSILYNSTFNF